MSGQQSETSKALTWWLVHTAHWLLLYAAFALQLDGAMHIVKFAVWALAVLSPAFLLKEGIERSAKDPSRPLRRALTRVQSWTTLGLLVWFGHPATAVAWCFAMFCAAYHRLEVDKLREAARGAA